MNPKAFYIWIYKKVSSYNLFMLEQHDYDDDDDAIRDPNIIVRKQKYKTWLYVILLAICLYILFYGTWIEKESETMIISNITLDTFDQMYAEYSQTLSCPCSTIAMSYKNFVSNNITMHSVCSSIFIGKEWIKELYLPNASRYDIRDFRKVAYSQFELLSKLCILSQDIKSQIEFNVDHIEFVSINLLSKRQVQSEIDNTIEFQKNNAFHQMISFLNYWRTTIQRNFLISALGTNSAFLAIPRDYGFIINGYQTSYIVKDDGSSVECGLDNPVIQATFPLLSNDSTDLNEESMLMFNYTIIDGFFLGCTPLDALLASTLDCLYEYECIQLFFDYFPNLNQIRHVNWNTTILSSKHDNKSILDYFQNLFIENWSSNINYSAYFDQCSPSMCTYTTVNRKRLSYAITLLISLYGGLIIILRLLASYIINILFKYKYHLNVKTGYERTVQLMKQLNLFRNINHRTESHIKQQKIATRLYLILLIASICVLCIFTSLNTEIVIITVSNPSLTSYNSLEKIYSTALRCPCANKTISYQTFISLSPVFHQICSSGFVTTDWIQQMLDSTQTGYTYDWRTNAYKQFQSLSDLCQLANKTIESGMNKFLSQSFIASSLMNEIDFDKQLNASLNQFYQSTVYNFDLMKDMIHLIQQVDQYHEGLIMQMMGSHSDPAMMMNIVENKSDFILYGINDINSGVITCVCATNPSCQRPAVVYDTDGIDDWNAVYGYGSIHNMTGWTQGCLARDSILLSTLQCLYADSDCFPFLMSYIIKTNTDALSLSSSLSRLEPLVYDPVMTRFPRDATISMLVQELMIEKWNPISSYKQFYKSCAPVYCSYSENVRKYNFLDVIIRLISMIGGIVVSLRIVTPHLIKLILALVPMFKKKSNQIEQVQRSNGNRLIIMIRNVIKLLRTTLVELNIFPSRDLGSDVDRVTAKRYGRWATRLYLILFIICLTILIFYTIIQSRPLIRTFDQPSFNYYNQLREFYGNNLKCSCSRIASTYNQFVNIQPIFHSICSSEFVSNEWRRDLINGLITNLSIYDQRDYRRFLSAHLQYLQGLCQLSIQTVNNSVNEFLTSLLITNELLSQNNFNDRLITLIEQSKSNAPTLFSHLLFFTQSILHGNTFESTYGTNFELIGILNIDYNQFNFYSKPIIYDNECSCGSVPNCTTQATFIETNSSKKFSVKGMKMGCTPSESLLASTLECFYDQSCLNLIQQYTNYENFSISLSSTSSHFSQNTTIDDLVLDLFIEEWSTDINYSLYYQQCLPLLCSYTTIEQFNILYTITLILGLQGGLTIVLKWICPKLVRIVATIYYNRKTRRISNYPAVSIEVPFSITTNIPIGDSTQNNAHRPMNLTFEKNILSRSQSSFKMISIIILLICILISVVIFSIYYARQNSMKIISINDSLITTTRTIIPMSSNTLEATCQLKVKRISIDPQCYPFSTFGPYVIADINDDNRLDFIFSCEYGYMLKALLANSNGSFEEVILIYQIFPVLQIRIIDINNDDRVDIVLAINTMGPGNINILYGNGNGTFQTENIKMLSVINKPTDFDITDVNNDSKLDLIVISQYVNEVHVFFGIDNEIFTLQPQLKLFLGLNSYANQLIISDFDNDGYLDIAAMNSRSLHIHVFLRNTNGSFQSQKWFYTAFDTNQYKMIAGHFHNNYQSDIVFLHSWKNTVLMFYQYNNNTFHYNEQIVRENSTSLDSQSVIVRDLNADNHLDIILGLPSSDEIYALLNDGNGHFQTQTLYSSILNDYTDDVDIFNNNNICQNIINMNFMSNTLYILFNPCQCLTY